MNYHSNSITPTLFIVLRLVEQSLQQKRPDNSHETVTVIHQLKRRLCYSGVSMFVLKWQLLFTSICARFHPSLAHAPPIAPRLSPGGSQ